MNKETTVPSHTERVVAIAPELVRREKAALEKHSQLRFVHWLAVFLSFVLTVSIWQYSRMQVALRTEARFDHAANQIEDLIRERLKKY